MKFPEIKEPGWGNQWGNDSRVYQLWFSEGRPPVLDPREREDVNPAFIPFQRSVRVLQHQLQIYSSTSKRVFKQFWPKLINTNDFAIDVLQYTKEASALSVDGQNVDTRLLEPLSHCKAGLHWNPSWNLQWEWDTCVQIITCQPTLDGIEGSWGYPILNVKSKSAED